MHLVKPYLEFTSSIVTILAVLSALVFGIRRFVLERITALGIGIKQEAIHDAGNLVLVAITVHLENRGETRIESRRHRTANCRYVYDEHSDECEHAGTLKIRAIECEAEPLIFDWYSLAPMRISSKISPADEVIAGEIDLEQVNYLVDYQDPQVNYADTDFWIEPHESYDLTVMIWLRPGLYATKAFFFGRGEKYQKEEYWSRQIAFVVGSPLAKGRRLD